MIDVSAKVHAELARVRRVLVDDPGSVLAARSTPEERRSHRFRAELAVELGAGANVSQEVAIEVGVPRLEDGAMIMPFRWHATGRARLFPTFEGELEAVSDRAGTRLGLAGRSTAPLGRLGKLGGGVLGDKLASRSLGLYVDEIAQRLDEQVRRQLGSGSWHPAPHAETPRDEPGPARR